MPRRALSILNVNRAMDDLSSRRHSYVVTAHKPTAVGQCAVGNFTGRTTTDLIIAYVDLSDESRFVRGDHQRFPCVDRANFVIPTHVRPMNHS